MTSSVIILHVDDDADDREIFMEALLEVNPDIQCLTAENGMEAHVRLTDGLLVQNLDCIFIDINMPLLDGIALLAIIKGDRRLSKIPVYVHSSGADEKSLVQIKKLGGKFIGKNPDYESLVQSLRDILKITSKENRK